jgi:acyl carrier protein
MTFMMAAEELNSALTLARVAEIFRDRLNAEVPSVDSDLFESGTLDSLAFVNLLVYLEEAFKVKVSLDDLEVDDFRSISRVSKVIDARLANLRASSKNGDASHLPVDGGDAA